MGVAQRRLACAGGFQAPACAVEQAREKDVLDFLQRLGDGGLRESHLGGHAAEGAVALDLLQQGQVAQLQARHEQVLQVFAGARHVMSGI
jgi:uncharacterized protein